MDKNNKQAKPLENRVFGLIFCGIFAVIALFPIPFGGGLRLWAVIIAILWAVPSLFFPKVLTPLNNLWQKFGLLMHKITNPILMGLIFFLTVIPTGIVLKTLGKDPMNRKFDRRSSSYWIPRENTQLTKESFDDQF